MQAARSYRRIYQSKHVGKSQITRQPPVTSSGCRRSPRCPSEQLSAFSVARPQPGALELGFSLRLPGALDKKMTLHLRAVNASLWGGNQGRAFTQRPGFGFREDGSSHPMCVVGGGAALWPLGAGVCQSAGAEGSRIMWVPALGSLDADTGRVTSTMWLNKVNLLVAEKEAHRQIGCLEGIIIYQSK